MKKHPNLFLGLLLAAVTLVAALQGQRVNDIRESTDFYRWIESAATQVRLAKGGTIEQLAQIGDDYGEANQPKVDYMDDELFAKVAEKVEAAPSITEPAPQPSDLDPKGEPYPKLVRLVNVVHPDSAKAEEESGAGIGETGGEWDREIWALASSDKLADERAAFLTLRREKRLASLGGGLSAEQIVGTSQDDPSVSMVNMFFGFRKMAANLLWLQVDKYWHAGHLHRMVPLMKTCVALDPNFVDAFLLGAWHLAYNVTAQLPETPEPLKVYDPVHQARVGAKERYYFQAADFLKDGIRKNPRNYKLYFDLGFTIYEQKLSDYANAVEYLSEAIRYKHDRWVPRQLAIAQQKNGQYREALAGWKAYYQKYPDNPNAQRFIRINEALIIEDEADRVAASGDEAHAKELRDKAHAMWADIADKDQDPYALMRLRRMDALDFARQGRYFEANGLLDQARYETPAHFDDISELMIKIKKEGHLPLSMSEKMFLARKAEADQYIADELRKITGTAYELKDDVWYQQGYNNEPTTLLTPGSELLKRLRAEHDIVNLVVSFRQPVVLELDGTWYHYRPKVI